MTELAGWREWCLIFGMMLVTFLPRYLPLALADRFRIPPMLRVALEFVPIAVLTAIIAQTTFVQGGEYNFSISNAHIYGVTAALAAAWLTKHMFKTIAVGLIVYAIAFVIINQL